MNRVLLVLLSLVLAVALAYFCVKKHMLQIPIDIKNRTYDSIAAADIAAVGVTVDGRDVILTGIVESDEIKIQAEKAARKTDGVRLVENQLMVVPPALPEPAEEVSTAPTVEEINQQCQDKLTEIMAANSIIFASGSTNIDAKSISLLDEIATIARDCPNSRIVVSGHTDNTGPDAVNQTVSEKRAQAVADYLRNTAKLSQTIEATGYGSSKPVTSNDTKEGRSKNRRIEFNVLSIE